MDHTGAILGRAPRHRDPYPRRERNSSGVFAVTSCPTAPRQAVRLEDGTDVAGDASRFAGGPWLPSRPSSPRRNCRRFGISRRPRRLSLGNAGRRFSSSSPTRSAASPRPSLGRYRRRHPSSWKTAASEGRHRREGSPSTRRSDADRLPRLSRARPGSVRAPAGSCSGLRTRACADRRPRTAICQATGIPATTTPRSASAR